MLVCSLLLLSSSATAGVICCVFTPALFYACPTKFCDESHLRVSAMAAKEVAKVMKSRGLNTTHSVSHVETFACANPEPALARKNKGRSTEWAFDKREEGWSYWKCKQVMTTSFSVWEQCPCCCLCNVPHLTCYYWPQNKWCFIKPLLTTRYCRCCKSQVQGLDLEVLAAVYKRSEDHQRPGARGAPRSVLPHQFLQLKPSPGGKRVFVLRQQWDFDMNLTRRRSNSNSNHSDEHIPL